MKQLLDINIKFCENTGQRVPENMVCIYHIQIEFRYKNTDNCIKVYGWIIYCVKEFKGFLPQKPNMFIKTTWEFGPNFSLAKV